MSKENMSTYTVMIESDLQVVGVRVRAPDRDDAERFANSLVYDELDSVRRHPRVVSVWFVEERNDW